MIYTVVALRLSSACKDRPSLGEAWQLLSASGPAPRVSPVSVAAAPFKRSHVRLPQVTLSCHVVADLVRLQRRPDLVSHPGGAANQA
jgi:hypothetical protein